MRTQFLLWLFALTSFRPAISADDLTKKDTTAARKIYVAKCAKCHQFYEPTNYAEPDWRVWMEKMNKKSKLKGAPASLLNRYLDAYRAGRLPGKPQDKPTTLGGAAVR